MSKKYTAELTITPAVAERSHGGVIYYFCHIHSKMSGKIIIKNADGSDATQAGGAALTSPTELALYSPTLLTEFDAICGTHGLADYTGAGAKTCSEAFLCGDLDSNFGALALLKRPTVVTLVTTLTHRLLVQKHACKRSTAK